MSFLDAVADLIDLIFRAEEEGLVGQAEAAVQEAARARARSTWLEQLCSHIASCQPSAPPYSDGPVQIEGRAIAVSELRAPLAGQRTIGYRLQVTGLHPVRPHSPSSNVFVDRALVRDFDLAPLEGEGTVRVCASTACLPLLLAEPTQTLALDDIIQPNRAQLLDLISAFSNEAVNYQRFEVSESRLDPGERVFVFGVARRETDPSQPAAGYRAPPQRVVVSAPPGGLLVVADQDRGSLLRSLGAGAVR